MNFSTEDNYEDLQGKIAEFQAEKQRWLISKKLLKHMEHLDDSHLTDSLLLRINFWKKSLFPSISIDDFWAYIDKIEPASKLKILETELIIEKNHLPESNSYKDKLRSLIEKEKTLNKKEADLKCYQDFLENECIQIQKQWNEISKYTDVEDQLEKTVNFNSFHRNQIKSMGNYIELIHEASVPEISASHIEYEQSLQDSNDEEAHFRSVQIGDIEDDYTIPSAREGVLQAVRVFVNKIKYKRRFYITKGWNKWLLHIKGRVVPKLKPRFEQVVKITMRNEEKTPPRRIQIKNERNYNVRTPKNKFKKYFFIALMGLLRAFRTKNKLLKFFYLKKWAKVKQQQVRCLKYTGKNQDNYKKNTENVTVTALKVIFFLSVYLSLSITNCKKMLSFRMWKMILIEERNRDFEREFEVVENKIHANIDREKSSRIENKIVIEKLRAKLEIVESQMKSLKVFAEDM